MKKKNKRKKLRYYLTTIFFVLMVIFWLGLAGAYVLNKHRWDKAIENGILAVLSVLISFFYYRQTKNVGTTNGDDERDEYLETKTNSQMFKVTNVLIFILGMVFLIWGAFLWQNSGTNTLVIILMTIAVTLIVLWNILLLIQLILGIINEICD